MRKDKMKGEQRLLGANEAAKYPDYNSNLLIEADSLFIIKHCVSR
jgi:hypothetical protein